MISKKMIKRKKEKACRNLMKGLISIKSYKSSQKSYHIQQIPMTEYRFRFKKIRFTKKIRSMIKIAKQLIAINSMNKILNKNMKKLQ